MFPYARSPGWAGEQRRADLARIDDVVIKTTSVCGFELVSVPAAAPDATAAAVGETTVDVSFPVTFTERPAMTFGGELDVNEFVEANHFPTISGVVVVWRKAHEDRVGGGLQAPGWYVGATVAVVASGRSGGFKVWLHWRAEGKAMRDPGRSAPTNMDQTL